MESLSDPNVWVALVTLTMLEIVLGIDNIIFISIISGKLPQEQQARARQLGLGGAVVTRLALLASIFWLAHLTEPLFTAFGEEISIRDLVLIVGGLFLLAKSTFEIHGSLEATEGEPHLPKKISFTSVIVQIMLLDIVFSLDSVITAIGMADVLWVMAAAVIIAVGVMLLFAGIVSDFVQRHPTIKMLALSFLLLIGVALIAEGLDLHIPKGYIYFAMAFSFFVEMLNMRLRVTPVRRVTPKRDHA
ncbi:MAG TPA: TerC family protein [Gammaproteobacteria bacterium]|nr:TerC family protein [Gammaproteobacteria bacterium]